MKNQYEQYLAEPHQKSYGLVDESTLVSLSSSSFFLSGLSRLAMNIAIMEAISKGRTVNTRSTV